MGAGAEFSDSIHAATANFTSQLFGGGLIGLREGLEAVIVVAVLAAVLVRSQRRDGLKWTLFGVAAAVMLTVGVFLTSRGLGYTAPGVAWEAISGISGIAALVTVAMVTALALWVRSAKAYGAGSVSVFALAFLAAGREGAESALFVAGYADPETAWPFAGLAIGVLAAVLIAVLIAILIAMAVYAGFPYTRAFLIVLAAGILSAGVGALQVAGWLPGLGSQAFDISSWLNWSSWYGQIVQGVFNVTPTPTVLQFAAAAAYLGVALFLASKRETAPKSRAKGSFATARAR